MAVRRRLIVLFLSLAALGCQSAPETGTPLPPLATGPLGGDVIPSYPDLRGSWSAVLRAISSGEGADGLGTGSNEIQLDYLRLTLSIDVQEGRLFYGTIRNGSQEESFAGSFREGGREAMYITREGRGLFWLDPAEPDTIEICGGRGTPDTLLALCGRMTREP